MMMERWIRLTMLSLALAGTAGGQDTATTQPSDHTAVPAASLAQMQAQMVPADDKKMEDVNKIRRYRSILRNGRELERDYPEAENLYIVRSLMLEAMRGLVELQTEDLKPEEVLTLSHKIVDSSAPAAWRIGADTLLTQLDVARLLEEATTRPAAPATPSRTRVDTPVEKALRAYMGRYEGTEVCPDALMSAALLAQQAKESTTLRDLTERMENSYFDEPRVRVFLRERLGRMVSRSGESVVGELTLLDGRTLRLPQDLFGKVVLVHFWSCKVPRCLEALDTLKSIYQEYHPRGLEIVSVCVDRERGELERLVKERGLNWIQAYSGKGSEDPLLKAYGVQTIPSYWIINPDGRIAVDLERAHARKDLYDSLSNTADRSWRMQAWLEACRSGEFLAPFLLDQLAGNPPGATQSAPGTAARPAGKWMTLADKVREAYLACPAEQKTKRMQEVRQLCQTAEQEDPHAPQIPAVRLLGLMATQWLGLHQGDRKLEAEAAASARRLLADKPAQAWPQVLADYLVTRSDMLQEDSGHKESSDRQQDTKQIGDFTARYEKTEAGWMAYPLAAVLAWETGQRPRVAGDLREAMRAANLRAHPEIRTTMRSLFDQRLEKGQPAQMELRRLDGKTLNLPGDLAGKLVVVHLGTAAAPPAAPWTTVSQERCEGTFVRDRQTHQTEQVGRESTGAALSPDGRYLAYNSVGDGTWSIVLLDRQTGQKQELGATGENNVDRGQATGVSTDGHLVALWSTRDNLVVGDTNKKSDIFVWDRGTKKIERVSVLSDGTQINGPSHNAVLSADGRYVAFQAQDPALGDRQWTVLLRDRQAGSTTTIAPGLYPAIACPGSSGPVVAFQSTADKLATKDTNRCEDIFVYEGGKIERVSVAADGTEANGPSLYPALSADGRFVSFASRGYNLVSADHNDKADIFVYDRQTRKIERVSVATDGSEANGDSMQSVLSADGRYVAFTSMATNLVPGDMGGVGGVFVHDRQTHQTELVSVSTSGVAGNRESGAPALSADGRIVAFDSKATNLGPGKVVVSAYQELKIRPEMAIVAVSLDRTPQAAEELARLHPDWIVAHAGQGAADPVVRQYGIYTLPATWVIAPSGRIYATDADLDLAALVAQDESVTREINRGGLNRLEQWTRTSESLQRALDGYEVARILNLKTVPGKKWKSNLETTAELVVRSEIKLLEAQRENRETALKKRIAQLGDGSGKRSSGDITKAANADIESILAGKKQMDETLKYADGWDWARTADLGDLRQTAAEGDCLRVGKTPEGETLRQELARFFPEVPVPVKATTQPASQPAAEPAYWLFRVKPL